MAVVAVSMAEATSTHCKCNAMRNAKGTQLLASFYEWNVDNFNGMDLILIENFFITHNNRHNTHTHTHWESSTQKPDQKKSRANERQIRWNNTKGRLYMWASPIWPCGVNYLPIVLNCFSNINLPVAVVVVIVGLVSLCAF